MSGINNTHGCFYGVGVGPGDPELITLKAARLIQQADVISFLVNDKGHSQSKDIAAEVLSLAQKTQLEIPLLMPMAENPEVGNKVYDKAAIDIQTQLKQGKNVVFLCEGDPLFFGSFGYLLQRLQTSFNCQVIPGISSPHAASAALKMPLTMLKESFSVISGRHDDDHINQTLKDYDSVVIMKAGRARPRLLALLNKCNRLHEASYLEYIGRDNEIVTTDVSSLDKAAVGPYFSLFVVIRQERQR